MRSIAYVALGITLLLGIVCANGSSVYSMPNNVECAGNDAKSYASKATITPDMYNLYVNLGAAGQTAPVEVMATEERNPTECQSIGSIEASGDGWSKVGSYNVRYNDTPTFHLLSPALTSVPNANRPTLMLVSQTNPVCIPDRECTTTVVGEQASIRPVNVSQGGSLQIVHAQNLPMSEVKEVRYYVDSELLYTTSKLEEFNLRVLPYYGSKMIRAVEYNSGQLAVISEDIPLDREVESIGLILTPLYKYKHILSLVGTVVGATVLFSVVRGLAAAYQRRQQWRIHHGLVHDRRREPFLQRHSSLRGVWEVAGRFIGRIIPFIIGGVVAILLGVGATSYVIQLSTVQGNSMEYSFRSGGIVLVNKLPISLARINQSNYVPERGRVVVAYPNFGVVDETVSSGGTIMKRVIGLPGERVVVDSTTVTIYNDEHPEGFNPELTADWYEDVISGNGVDRLDTQLNEDQLFIIGDNRPDSVDSRYSGSISTHQVVGLVHEW